MSEFELNMKREMKEFFKLRDELYDYLDKNLPKDKNGLTFDFSDNPKLDAKELYELFYDQDYQARKAFAVAINYFKSLK